MRRRNTAAVHSMGCTCKACRPAARPCTGRAALVAAFGRALLLTAAVLAVPFVIAFALKNADGGGR
ncbi:MAG: hypothetical protein P8Y58_04665 [Novosphingobium sp.]